MAGIERHWQTITPVSLGLLPLALLFRTVVTARRALYRSGLLRSYTFRVPVIVVGNITVGGTGKTPFVLWLARALRERGHVPAIISRGYGGKSDAPRAVHPEDDPATCGDEPLLLSRHGGCPVWTGRDRVATARALLAAHPESTVIVSDDGLQHYRLERAVEVAIVDGARGFGNGLPLPSGPLREPVTRLAETDLVVVNGPDSGTVRHRALAVMTLKGVHIRPLTPRHESGNTLPPGRVHAVAGIGNPERFFEHLRLAGFDVLSHPFPDHHGFRANELDFGDSLPVVMTEKDAVKCERFARSAPTPAGWWSLDVEAEVDASAIETISRKLEAR
jgi:tetraacyldisaccharide 4'-kinase